MQTKTALPALIALLLTGSLITAQSDPKKPQDPVQPKPATASKVEPGTPLKFSVTGLTKDNSDKVKQSLMSMQAQSFVCEGCKHEQGTAGRCSPCNLDLKAVKGPVFSEVVPSFETETIRVTPMATRSLRYSDLASALTKNTIEIDSAEFPIAGKSHLVLVGGTQENAKVIEKALVDAKLFESVKATYEAASGEIHVAVQANATPAMHAKVLSTIDELGTKAKLTDVIWGSPATPAKV